MPLRRTIVILCLLAALAVGAWFYTQPMSGSAQRPGPPAPPPPEVGVATVHAAEVPLPVEYSGRLAAFRDVEVRAQVSGVLLKREFNEGDKVEKGQVLFRIDPRPYQVALERAQAQFGQAQATLRQQEENFARIEQLAQRGVATQKQLDDVTAARDQARASIKVSEAEIESAKLNLGYTTITAPIAGPTRLQSPPEGALIQAQQTLLTTIQQLDPAYVSVSVTDSEYQSLRALASDRDRPIKGQDLVFRITYGDGRAYPETGKLDVSSSFVDPQTGTVQVRTVFPNPKGELLPGQFVRVGVSGLTLPNAIVVPKPAIGQGPQGPFVYVVGSENTSAVRPVRLGRELAGGIVVSSGLTDGERIVVDGVIRVRPGTAVRPVEATASAPKAGAGGPPSGGGAPK